MLQVPSLPLWSSKAANPAPPTFSVGKIASITICPSGLVTSPPVPIASLPAGHDAVVTFGLTECARS